MFKISFGSDNHSGIHPQVLDAITQANNGYCAAYGDDPLTLEVLRSIETLFGGDCEAWFVMTGTGANVLSLQSLMQSFHAVICASTSHINVDECGAVQKFTQARLSPIDTPDASLLPSLLLRVYWATETSITLSSRSSPSPKAPSMVPFTAWKS